MSARRWIKELQLEPHPEGGYFKEVYRSNKTIQQPAGGGVRNLATSIYFLLEAGQKSHFHQLKSDELWYYHLGDPVVIHVLMDGEYQCLKLGKEEGDHLQVFLPANSIFAAEVVKGGNFALMGCMVTPGFDFKDFRLLSSEELSELFPEQSELIKAFTIS